jgi:hypothetical protein
MPEGAVVEALNETQASARASSLFSGLCECLLA